MGTGRLERKPRTSKRREGTLKEELPEREADMLRLLDGEKTWRKPKPGGSCSLTHKPINPLGEEYQWVRTDRHAMPYGGNVGERQH
jgi:hypothetical protein